jgi:hypothetical protein
MRIWGDVERCGTEIESVCGGAESLPSWADFHACRRPGGSAARALPCALHEEASARASRTRPDCILSLPHDHRTPWCTLEVTRRAGRTVMKWTRCGARDRA